MKRVRQNIIRMPYQIYKIVRIGRVKIKVIDKIVFVKMITPIFQHHHRKSRPLFELSSHTP